MRMPSRGHRFGLVAAIALMLSASRASATDFCIVQVSADGFVALRSRPSADGALLVRAKPGEAVVIQKSAAGDHVVSGSWLRVLHFPDTVPPAKSDPAFRLGKLGWMHRRYIVECG